MTTKRIFEFGQYVFDHIMTRFVVLFIIYAALVIGFVALAESVTAGNTLLIDEAILEWVYGLTSSTLSSIMLVVTQLGSTIFVGFAAVALLLCFLIKRLYRSALLVVVSIGGAGLLIIILKQLFTRQRPMLWQHLVAENGFSFPSGHGIGSSALTFTVVVLLWRTKWRYAALILGCVYMFAVAFSRLYLGVHYPSDIVGSWLVSGFWLLSVVTVFRYGGTKKSHV